MGGSMNVETQVDLESKDGDTITVYYDREIVNKDHYKITVRFCVEKYTKYCCVTCRTGEPVQVRYF